MKVSLFQGVLIGVFVLAALLGLYAFATYQGSVSSADEVGKVVVWGTLPGTDLTTALNAISRIDASFKTVSYVEKNSATLPAEIATAIATGAPPDLILASQEEMHSLRKFIATISSKTVSPSTFTNGFIDESSLLMVPDGSGYYGVPFLVDPLVLFWNDDILASNGIAKPPATWEALVGLVPTLAILTPTKQITRGLIALGTYNNVHNARGILSALFLQTRIPISTRGSGDIYRAELSSALGGGGSSAGEAVVGFYTQFADPSKVSYTWNNSLPDSRQSFQTGDLALYLGYVSEARTLTALNPNLNFKVAPLPQPATASEKTTYGRLYSLMLPRGARNASGAFKIATLLTKSAEQKIMSEVTGLAPVSRTSLATPPADAVAAVAYSSALYSRGWLSPAAGGVDAVWSSMITDVITGRQSAGAALTKAAGALTILLQQ